MEGGEGSDSFKGSDVVGSGIVKGRANDFLKLSSLSGGGRGGGVSGGKLRGGGSIDGRDIGRWRGKQQHAWHRRGGVV